MVNTARSSITRCRLSISASADQRVDGFDDHAFGEAAHFRDQPGQFLQIAVERLGGMFRNHGSLLSRTGR
jgi:hypothetical protein